MNDAAKRKSSLTAGLTVLRAFLLIIACSGLNLSRAVPSAQAETRVWVFPAQSELASSQIAFATPSFIGENYDAFAYDGSGSLVDSEDGGRRVERRAAYLPPLSWILCLSFASWHGLLLLESPSADLTFQFQISHFKSPISTSPFASLGVFRGPTLLFEIVWPDQKSPASPPASHCPGLFRRPIRIRNSHC
jgi:hypothetical protein